MIDEGGSRGALSECSIQEVLCLGFSKESHLSCCSFGFSLSLLVSELRESELQDIFQVVVSHPDLQKAFVDWAKCITSIIARLSSIRLHLSNIPTRVYF